MRKYSLVVVIFIAMFSATKSEARNFPITGMNELSGGFGFAAPITDWAPGGFKWFNDYSRQVSELTWFNVQLNVTAGGSDRSCWNDRGHWDCDHWNGNALELAAGVKLKWRVSSIPLQIHAKLGGAVDFLFLWNEVKGAAIGFRGGAGVRYFFVPSFGVGIELVHTIGPAFLNHDIGAEIYSTIDFNTGVEWRF